MTHDNPNNSGPDGLKHSLLMSLLLENYFDNPLDLKDWYVHAGLFKDTSLSRQLSEGDNCFLSSGTSGNPTKVYFSRTDAIEQQRSLIRIMERFIPKERNSAIICLNVNPKQMNARLAAARGFSLLASKTFYEDAPTIQIYKRINECVNNYKQIILFAFTYDLFCLIKRLLSFDLLFSDQNYITIIHGGGWKKNYSESIPAEEMNMLINQVFPGCRVINYYGMIEQLGNIYPTCSLGFHHTSDNNDIIIRDKLLREASLGEEGIIQTILYSDICKSNSSILTEDIGKIVSYHCKCGRPGKAFTVKGRISKSEIRGCSNAYI